MQEQDALPVKNRKPRSRGRPKDPDLESRVYDAAIRLYSDVGWAGFNFEQIAKLSGVGKAALYSRWPKREDLLIAIFELRWQRLAEIDTGNLREDLRAIADHAMNRFSSSNIAINMQADGQRYEDFRALAAPFSRKTFQFSLTILKRAIDRGELHADTNLEVVILTILGSIGARIARVDMDPIVANEPKAIAYLDGLVDLLMEGLQRQGKAAVA